MVPSCPGLVPGLERAPRRPGSLDPGLSCNWARLGQYLNVGCPPLLPGRWDPQTLGKEGKALVLPLLGKSESFRQRDPLSVFQKSLQHPQIPFS